MNVTTAAYSQVEYLARRLTSVSAAYEQLLIGLFVRNSYVILAIVLKRVN